MGNLVLYMSVSLDGFIAGPGDDLDHSLGHGGDRLHDWLASDTSADGAGSGDPPGHSATVLRELLSTGAVLAGRRTYDLVQGWGGSHHGVPVVVLTHEVPDDVPTGDPGSSS